jgi:hypothetical protein
MEPSTSTPRPTEQPVGTNPFRLSYWVGRIDLRGIALFRIALGLFLVYDLLDFAPDLRAWFSNEGVMPLPALLGQWARTTRFVPFDAFATPVLVWIYWALAMAVALAVTLGYRTRLANALAFVLFAGFQERLPPLFDGSDTVLRVVLFWHAFTASGNVWSLDAWRAESAGQPLSRLGAALPVRLVGLQVGWVYFCSVFWKLSGHKWHDGTAVHFAMHLSHVFARPWAAPLADVAWLCQAITWSTLVIEASFIFLTHFPLWPRRAKAAALLAGAALHGGIFLTINVGHFSLLMPLTYLSMFEGDWAQAVVDRVRLPATWTAGLRRLAGTLPEPRAGTVAPGLRNLGTAALAVFFGLVSWYSLPKQASNLEPQPVQQLIQYASMWSSWDMFAPEPLSTDYHLSAPAVYEDGTTADLFGEGGEARGFLFSRWWKYLENVTGGGEVLPLEWGRYLCREHNYHLRPGQPRLYTFTLYKDNQVIPALGQAWPKVERQQVWKHRCYDLPAGKPEPSMPVASNQAPRTLP